LLDPDSAAAHRRVGQLLLEAGSGPEGEQELRRAIELEPKASWAYIELAEWLQRQKRQPEARVVLDRGLVAHPGTFDLTLARAQLELADGRPVAARTIIQGYHPLEEGPDARLRLVAFQGDIFATEGRPVQALQAYRTAAALAPGAGFEFRCAELLEGLSDFQAAADTLRRLSPGDPETRALVARRIEADEKRAEDLRQSRQNPSIDPSVDPPKSVDEAPEIGGERTRESQ
jgi:predicted Zn-dependent protease